MTVTKETTETTTTGTIETTGIITTEIIITEDTNIQGFINKKGSRLSRDPFIIISSIAD